MSLALWVIIGIIAVLVLVAIFIYNGLVRLRVEVKNSFANIDVQLKRRNDLIPNLVETVKGYAKHEKSVFTEITKARSAMMNAQSPTQKAKASNMLSDTLKSLFAVTENYPTLKADQNFRQLQEELTGTENKIAYSRQHYNDMVTLYNTRVQVVPYNLFANMFNFKKFDMFEATAEERKNVKVKFD
jgi:LemA protein